MQRQAQTIEGAMQWRDTPAAQTHLANATATDDHEDAVHLPTANGGSVAGDFERARRKLIPAERAIGPGIPAVRHQGRVVDAFVCQRKAVRANEKRRSTG